MDIYAGISSTNNALVDLICSFNTMFADISPVVFQGRPSTEPPDPNIVISRFHLTPHQLEHIKHMSGFITTVKEGMDTVKYRYHQEGGNDQMSERLELLENLLADKDRQLLAEERRTALLKEFIVNEINRAEEIERDHKIVEQELALAKDERSKLLKKVQSLQAAQANAIAKTKAATAVAANNKKRALDDTNEPGLEDGGENNENVGEKHDEIDASLLKTRNDLTNEQLVNMYVRKKFGLNFYFGLVVFFKKPWFKIVYEDGDSEELSKRDLIDILWESPIPVVRLSQCNDFAKKEIEKEGKQTIAPQKKMRGPSASSNSGSNDNNVAAAASSSLPPKTNNNTNNTKAKANTNTNANTDTNMNKASSNTGAQPITAPLASSSTAAKHSKSPVKHNNSNNYSNQFDVIEILDSSESGSSANGSHSSNGGSGVLVMDVIKAATTTGVTSAAGDVATGASNSNSSANAGELWANSLTVSSSAATKKRPLQLGPL